MRLNLMSIAGIGVALSGLSATVMAIGKEDEAKGSGYVKVEMKGQLRAYRMSLFGETAAAVKADHTEIWLDYSKNEEVKRKGIVSFDEKIVLVKGKLEFREFHLKLEAPLGGGEGPKPLGL